MAVAENRRVNGYGKALQGVLLVLGASMVVIGLGHLAFGSAIVPGGGPVNATLDSEDRFFGALALAYGAALLWCIADTAQKRRHIMLLAAVFFVGGLARLASVAGMGLPHPFFVAMTAIELILPIVMVLLAMRVG